MIRPNLPRHGIFPAAPTRQYTIHAFVANLEGLFRHFSLRRAALAGLSMSGVISQHFVLTNPQLLWRSYSSIQPLMGLDRTHGPKLSWWISMLSVLRKPSRNSPTTLSAQRLHDRCSSGAEQEVIRTPEFVARQR